jgi:hypothetical protein
VAGQLSHRLPGIALKLYDDAPVHLIHVRILASAPDMYPTELSPWCRYS